MSKPSETKKGIRGSMNRMSYITGFRYIYKQKSGGKVYTYIAYSSQDEGFAK